MPLCGEVQLKSRVPDPPVTLILRVVALARVVLIEFPVAPAIVGAGLTTTDKAYVVVAVTESVAVTVTEYVPAGTLLDTVKSPTFVDGFVMTNADG